MIVHSRGDIEGFLNRLAYLASTGAISTDARIRAAREVRHVLAASRAGGLTRPGAPAEGLGQDFLITTADIPDKPEAAKAGRDLPPEIMRQVCAHLDELASPRCVPRSSWPSTPGDGPRRSATCRSTAWPASPTTRPCWSSTTTRPAASAGGYRSAPPPPK